MYRDGRYATVNPGWHAEDASAKAEVVVGAAARLGLAPKRLVDVGCGTGDVLSEVAQRLATTQALGIDPSPEAIAIAQQHSRPGLQFESGELEGVLSEWDLVLCLDVVEHVADDRAFLKALRRIAPHVVFRFPLDESVVDRVTGRVARHRTQYGHLHAYTRRRILKRLRGCGYRVLLEQYHRIPPTTPGRLDRWRALGLALWPHGAVRVLGGYSLVVVAETTGMSSHG